MKSFLFGCFLFLFSLFSFFVPVKAQEVSSALLSEPVAETDVIFMFVRDDCGHCKDAKKFLTTSLLVDYPSTRVMYFNLEDPSTKTLFDQVTGHYELIKGTPLTLINGNLVQGYEADETTGKLFVSLLDAPHDSRSFEDIASGGAQVVTGSSVSTVCTEEGCELPGQPSYVVSLPFIGKTIDVGAFSLGSMSFILGLIDGFNPCALWVLIMFLFVLSQVGSRRRMVEYAGLFIFAETIMYYLILNVWFTAWDFISLNKVVTPLVGLLALGSGIYFLYKF
jgi:hypothetical protein